MEVRPQFPGNVWDGLSKNTSRTSRIQDIAPDSRDWDQVTAEVIQLETSILAGGFVTESESGTPEAITGVSTETKTGSIQKLKLIFEDFELPTVDAGAAGASGSLKLFTFPSDDIHVQVAAQEFAPGGVQARDGGGSGISDSATLTIAFQSQSHGITSDNLTLTGGVNTGWDRGITTLNPRVSEASDIELTISATLSDANHGPVNDALILNGTFVIHWIDLAGA